MSVGREPERRIQRVRTATLERRLQLLGSEDRLAECRGSLLQIELAGVERQRGRQLVVAERHGHRGLRTCPDVRAQILSDRQRELRRRRAGLRRSDLHRRAGNRGAERASLPDETRVRGDERADRDRASVREVHAQRAGVERSLCLRGQGSPGAWTAT